MKIEFDLDLSEKEIRDAFEPRINAALAASVSMLSERGKELAAKRLKSGLKFWEKGYKVDKIDDGYFVISLSGKMATMMEDGIQVGEISKMIMAGNRAAYNKSGYVDVPLGKDSDSMGNLSGTKINVSAFKDADALRKAVTFSDYKKGGVRTEQRILQRVEDVIKSTEPTTGKASFLTIRRVTDESVWPASPYAGAKILEDLEAELDSIFDKFADEMV